MEEFRKKRKSKRVNVNIPAGIYSKGKPWEVIDGEILNISMGGAFIHCDATLDQNEKVLVEIRFREAKIFEAQVVDYDSFIKENPPPEESPELSTIRWSQGSGPPGIGIQFAILKPENEIYLKKLIQHFEKKK